MRGRGTAPVRLRAASPLLAFAPSAPSTQVGAGDRADHEEESGADDLAAKDDAVEVEGGLPGDVPVFDDVDACRHGPKAEAVAAARGAARARRAVGAGSAG